MMKSALHPRVITLLLVLLTEASTVFPQEGGSSFPKWIILSGGVSVPLGEFSSTDFSSGGYAKAGGGIGIEAVTQPTNFTEMGVGSTFNFLIPGNQDRSENGYTLRQSDVWLVGGVYGLGGLSVNLSPSARLSLDGEVGIMFGRSPHRYFWVDTWSPLPGLTQSAAWSAALSYGFTVGIIVADKVNVGVDFLTGEPEYETTTHYAGSAEKSYKLRTSILQLRTGYVLALH